MAYEHKPGQGNLFKNASENPKAPALKGQVNVNGKTLDIAGWVATDDQGQPKRDKNGNTWINLKVSEPYTPQSESFQAPAPDFDDKIPF